MYVYLYNEHLSALFKLVDLFDQDVLIIPELIVFIEYFYKNV